MTQSKHSQIATELDSNYDHKRAQLRHCLHENVTLFPNDPLITNHIRHMARQVSIARRAVRLFEEMAGMYKVDTAHFTIAYMRTLRRKREQEARNEAISNYGMY